MNLEPLTMNLEPLTMNLEPLTMNHNCLLFHPVLAHVSQAQVYTFSF